MQRANDTEVEIKRPVNKRKPAKLLHLRVRDSIIEGRVKYGWGAVQVGPPISASRTLCT